MMLKLNKQEQAFIKTVKAFYKTHGRHDLLWRQTKDPYRILVSELMLQQTQVARVVPKYEAFIEVFPTAAQLAAASLGDVLRLWQGLGYNRRAKYLQQAAQFVTQELKGVFPQTAEALLALPGVGPYTASAVAAFAFDEPVVVVETNIRTVYIHHFFHDAANIPDSELAPRIARTLQTPSSEWYAALMDYGSMLKQTIGNKNRQSKTYQKQVRFEGSDRQIRGSIIRLLAAGPQTKQALVLQCRPAEAERIEVQLQKLVDEGLLRNVGRKFELG